MRVYVAGLYSRNRKGQMANVIEVLDNMRVGIKACLKILRNGDQPFCPWLDYLFFLMLEGDQKITEKQIKDYSMAWLRACKAMVVLSDWQQSPGTLDEMTEAIKLEIPIYHGVKAFLARKG